MALHIKYSLGVETEKTVVLEQQVAMKVCETVMAAMVNELPEEAHTIEVFNYILDETKKMIHSKVVELK